MDAQELIGWIASILNIASTVPPLRKAWAKGRNPDREQLQGRLMQLLANLLWLGYAGTNHLWPLVAATGVMSALLALLCLHHSPSFFGWWRPKR